MTIRLKSLTDKSFLYLLGIGIFTFLVCLFGYSYIGYFTRYATDDFCNLSDLEKYGWLDFQINQYLSWSGRFSATFFTATIDLAGDWIVMLLPGLALLFWIVCMTWCVYQYIKLLDTKYSFLVSIFTALLIIFAIISTSPSLESILYWHVGLITYLFPLILLTLFAGLIGYAINNDRHRTLLVILGLSLAFIAGGHSETSLIGQIIALSFGLVFVYANRFLIPNHKAVTQILWAGFMGSCIAFAIVSLAPGNSNRQGFFPDPQLIPAFIKSNFYVVYLFFRPLMGLFEKPILILANYFAPDLVAGLERALSRSASPIIILVVMLFSALLAYRQDSNFTISFKRFIWYIALLFVPFYLMILSTIFPSQYIMSMFPPLRAIIVAQTIIVIFFLIFGFLLGQGLKNSEKLHDKVNRTKIFRILGWTIGGLLLLNLFVTMAQITKKVPVFQSYAQEYDQVMIEIRKAEESGQTALEIPLLDKPLFNDYIAFTETSPAIDFCAIKYFDMDITIRDID